MFTLCISQANRRRTVFVFLITFGAVGTRKFCWRDYLAAQQNPDNYSNNMDKNSKDGFVPYMMVAMATRP